MMQSLTALVSPPVTRDDPARRRYDPPSTRTYISMPRNPPRSPDRASIQRVAADTLKTPNVTVEKLTGHLYNTYRLQLPQGYFCVLRCRPTFNIRMLRHEEDRLASDASVLQLLSRREDVVAPRLLQYERTTADIGCFYTVTGPFTGAILASIGQTLSPQARADVDRSLGQYVRRLAAITGPAFGSVHQGSGSASWTKTFALLLESVLRDAEDSLVSLPYDTIRDQVRKHRASLDKIARPRLVMLEAASASGIVVNPATRQVVGLLDYSTGIWGDPFVCDCFYRPTQSFLDGFGDTVTGDNDKRIRHLLYVHRSAAVLPADISQIHHVPLVAGDSTPELSSSSRQPGVRRTETINYDTAVLECDLKHSIAKRSFAVNLMAFHRRHSSTLTSRPSSDDFGRSLERFYSCILPQLNLCGTCSRSRSRISSKSLERMAATVCSTHTLSMH